MTSTTTQTTATVDFEAAVDALLPSIRDRASEIEGARRLPADLIDDLRAAGLFRALLPRSHGGLESDYPTSVRILRSLARADGAVGWSLMIGMESPQLFSLLPRDVFDELYGSNSNVVIAGAFAPRGAAEPADGGYSVTGQWPFASGCEHSDWLFGTCIVPPATDGAPPAARCAMLPRDEWQILDTWHTAGLRGTGSHDIAIEGTFVPEAHTFDLFFGPPCIEGPLFAAPLHQFSMHIGAVALGIAEGAMDEVVGFATTGKKRLYGRSAMQESELFQYRLGRAEADLRAADALLSREATDHWSAAVAGEPPSHEQLPRVLQTVAWVSEAATRVVDTCYSIGGGSSVYDRSPLQRRLRDIHTLSQHASVQEGLFANNGSILLGIPPQFGF